MAKTLLIADPIMRGKEEFAEYWPHALNVVDQSALRRMGLNMAQMVDVFRTVYLQGFMKAAVVQLEELKAADKAG